MGEMLPNFLVMEHLYFKSLCKLHAFSDRRKCDPFLAAAGLAAGTGLVSSLISGRANKKLVRETNAQNREMFDEQMRQQAQQFQMSQDYQTMDWKRNRQAALEDWERETAYNDPTAQKQRYRNAGINPALAMTGQNQAVASMESTAGGSSPSPGGMPGIPQMQAPVDTTGEAISNAVGQFMNLRMSQEQLKQLEIDNSHRDQQYIEEILNKRADTSAKLASVAKDSKLGQLYQRQIDMYDEELFFMTQNRDNRLRQSSGDAAVAQHTANKLFQETRIAEIEADLESEFGRSRIIAELNERGANIQVLKESIAKIASDVSLNEAEIGKKVAETAHEWLKANLINPDSPEGRQAFEFIESQIYKNYQYQDGQWTSPWYYKNSGRKPQSVWRRHH